MKHFQSVIIVVSFRIYMILIMELQVMKRNSYAFLFMVTILILSTAFLFFCVEGCHL